MGDLTVKHNTYTYAGPRGNNTSFHVRKLSATGDQIRINGNIYKPTEVNKMYKFVAEDNTSCPCLVTCNYKDVVQDHLRTRKNLTTIKDIVLITNHPAPSAEEMNDARLNELEHVLLSLCHRTSMFTNTGPADSVLPLLKMLSQQKLFLFSPKLVYKSQYYFLLSSKTTGRFLCLEPRTREESISVLSEYGMVPTSFARADVDDIIIDVEDVVAHMGFGLYITVLHQELYIMNFQILSQLILKALLRNNKVQIID